MKYYINYADHSFKAQQKFAVKIARFIGGFDRIIAYEEKDIDLEFYRENKTILEQARGAGYWLWKPYFILKTLEKIKNDDYLFYCDSGGFLLKNINVLIDELEKYNQDIMGFELPLIESQWTKKELFKNMNLDSDDIMGSNQICGCPILIRKSDKSMAFFKEFLKYSCNEINITDKYNDDIVQDDDFIAHRHDQSVFSLCYKKHKLRPFMDITQFGKYPRGHAGIAMEHLEKNKLHVLDNSRKARFFEYTEKFGMVVYLCRRGAPLSSLIKYKVKEALFKCGFYKGFLISPDKFINYLLRSRIK